MSRAHRHLPAPTGTEILIVKNGDILIENDNDVSRFTNGDQLHVAVVRASENDDTMIPVPDGRHIESVALM